MKPFRNLYSKISEINVRYREPRIEMSGAVRMSLMALRLYLLVLVALMVYKFTMIVAQG